MATLVKFRISKPDGSLLAIFPQLKPPYARENVIKYYAEGGYWGACIKDCCLIYNAATPARYKLLKKKLEGLGYKLKICK